MRRDLTKAADELARKERALRAALLEAHRSDLGELLKSSAVRTGGQAGLTMDAQVALPNPHTPEPNTPILTKRPTRTLVH